MEERLEIVLSKTIASEDGSIFIDPICDFFGIQRRNQIERLKEDSICQSDMRKNINFSIFGDNRNRYCLGRRGFIRWIQIINPVILRKNLQELFIQYQIAVFDYLYEGSKAKTAQLEDLKIYNQNINRALELKYQLVSYIKEQNDFKNLCLEYEPKEWLKIRDNLSQTNPYPLTESESLIDNKSIEEKTPLQLQDRRKRLLNNINKSERVLKYQSRKTLKEENPMPDGFRRATIELKLKKWNNELAQIEKQLLILE